MPVKDKEEGSKNSLGAPSDCGEVRRLFQGPMERRAGSEGLQAALRLGGNPGQGMVRGSLSRGHPLLSADTKSQSIPS